MDFLAGLLLKAVEAIGAKDFRGMQAQVGEGLAWRNMLWALRDAMSRATMPWTPGYVLPNLEVTGAAPSTQLQPWNAVMPEIPLVRLGHTCINKGTEEKNHEQRSR